MSQIWGYLILLCIYVDHFFPWKRNKNKEKPQVSISNPFFLYIYIYSLATGSWYLFLSYHHIDKEISWSHREKSTNKPIFFWKSHWFFCGITWCFGPPPSVFFFPTFQSCMCGGEFLNTLSYLFVITWTLIPKFQPHLYMCGGGCIWSYVDACAPRSYPKFIYDL